MSYAFINRMCQNWRGKTWRKYGEVCPYWNGHASKQPQLKFVKDSLFRRYYTNHPKQFKRGEKYPPRRGGSEHKHNKLYRFYWFLHPEPVKKTRRSSKEK